MAGVGCVLSLITVCFAESGPPHMHIYCPPVLTFLLDGDREGAEGEGQTDRHDAASASAVATPMWCQASHIMNGLSKPTVTFQKHIQSMCVCLCVCVQ